MTAVFSSEAFERYANALTQTERLPRPRLEAYQAGLLRRLVTFAFENSPFYAERLKPLFRDGGNQPNLRFWEEIPILRRRDLANEIDRINPVQVPGDVGSVATRRTSGTTTGSGLNFRICDIAKLAAEGMMHRLFRWHGFDVHAPLASIRFYGSGRRKYPDGVTEGFWCYAQAAPHYTLDYRTAVPDMIDWLRRRRPRYLLTFPSIAHDLAAQNAIEDVHIDAIVGISELVSADTAIDVDRTFGCEILRIYACAEMGCIALHSDAESEYEICEEAVLVEILDEQDNPVSPGDNGRVVLTSLYNYATPFIRYEIGDYATLSDTQAASGRTLRKLKRVTGRKRNALIHRNRNRLWDLDVITPKLCAQFPSHQFQIHQPDLETIQISFVPDPLKSKSPCAQILTDYFSAALGGATALKLSAVEIIPRTSGGKRERIISAVADA